MFRMKMPGFIIGTSLALCLFSLSLSFGETQKTKDLDDILPLITTQIYSIAHGSAVHRGTGFFISNSKEEKFLVTNRHLLYEHYDKCRNAHPVDEIQFYTHSEGGPLTQTIKLRMPTHSKGQAIWMVPENPDVDIAAIPLSKDLMQYSEIAVVHPSIIFTERDELYMGQQLMLVGYPHGFHDQVHKLPIARTVTIASQPDIPFEGQKYFFADGQIHPGMSGSPVLLRQSGGAVPIKNGIEFRKGPRYRLVGIHSASAQHVALHTVWHAELIQDLIENGE